jgi:mycothiol synthase
LCSQKISIRAFRWADLSALLHLENALHRAHGDTTPASETYLKEYLGLPNLHPEENLFLCGREGHLCGAVLVIPELRIRRAVLDLKVLPNDTRPDVEQALIRTALKRSRDLGAAAMHVQKPPTAHWRDLLLREGFHPCRLYWTMRWNVQELPPPQVPEGYSFRPYRGPEDVADLTRVQNAAFAGSWGFSPNTNEEIKYRASMSITPPGGIIFFQDGSRVAGYCWTFVMPRHEASVGIISMIGIHPDYRSRRLGRPLLQESLRYLASQGVAAVELEVDSANLPAIRLYHSLGFEKVAESQWFEASLAPPS